MRACQFINMVQTLKVDDVSYACMARAETQREMGHTKLLLIW